jgi:hypothetical protein
VDDLLEEVRFARDSPLEGDGFEPSPSPVDSRFSAGLRPSGAVKWTP